MGDSSRTGGKLGDSGLLELVGKLMVVAVVVLFFSVVFVFFIHLYAKWFWYRRPEEGATAAHTRRRRRFDFAPGYQELTLTSRLRPGLDPAVLKSIPILLYSAQDFNDGLECAVCLCELFEGEKARLLPKCNHGFHVDCIDMWFQSHSTCPLCRNLVSPQSTVSEDTIFQTPAGETSTANGFSSETPNFPTNVLFWGDETQVSTLELNLEENHQSGSSSSQTPCSSSSSSSSAGSGAVVSVIDIPRQINEEEEAKSPVTTRLRSLRRLLSGDRKVNPSNVDVEQGSRNQT